MIENIKSKADLAAFIRQTIGITPRARRLASYLTADIPAAAAHEGEVIYVSDGAAGAKFQGSNGSAWVNLG